MSSVAKRLGFKKAQEKKTPKPETKKTRQRKGIIKGVLILAIAIFGSWGFYEGMKLASGTQFPVVVVVSPSMEPAIHVGDLLFVHYVPPEDIKNGSIDDKTGDVILYDAHGLGWVNPPDDPIVHRVVNKTWDELTGMWYFMTKGDYNPDADPPDCTGLPCPGDQVIWVPQDHVLGVVWGDIPYIGYVKIWVSTAEIALPLMIIIGTLLVITIVWDTMHPEEEGGKKAKKGKKRDMELKSSKEIIPGVSELGYEEVVPKANAITPNPLVHLGATLERLVEYIGGNIRVWVQIANKGQAILHRVRISLDVPPSFRFLRVEPAEADHEGPVVNIHAMHPGEEKTAAWVLEPMICSKGRIRGTVTGLDAEGTPFTLALETLEVDIKCPVFATAKNINLLDVKKMLDKLPIRDQRVFLLPETLSENDALTMLGKVISERDVKLVGETNTGTEKQVMYYGETKNDEKRFIFIGGVSKIDRTIRITAVCEDDAGCVGFLADTGAVLRRELVSSRVVDSEDHVVELICKQCGASLPRAPAIGEDVTCPECKRIWAVEDFIHKI